MNYENSSGVTGRWALSTRWVSTCAFNTVRCIGGLWLSAVGWLGRIANLAGLPGLVRDCEYNSEATSTRVTVRRTALYTIITVNGTDVYFYRLTGGIDGVGASQASCCTTEPVPE